MSEKKPLLRDVDSAGRAQKLQAAAWSLVGAFIVGLLGGMRYGVAGVVVGGAAGGLIIWLLVELLADRAGRAAGSIFMPSGSSTPGPHQYSQGDALAAQGKLPAAIREYEQSIAAHPTDPEPRIRLARLYRDRMQQPEEAAYYFKHALEMTDLPPATAGAIARELIELFTHRMKAPTRALPILAKLAEQQPNTAAGQWARAELIEIKRHATSVDPTTPET